MKVKLLADLCIERISAQLLSAKSPDVLPRLDRLPVDLQQKLLTFSIRRKSLRDNNVTLFLVPHVRALHLEVPIYQYTDVNNGLLMQLRVHRIYQTKACS